MSAISDCRNCVKVTPLLQTHPGGFVFCQLLAHTVPAREGEGKRGGRGASPAAWVGVGGLRKSCSSWSSGSQLGLRPKQAPLPWLVEFLSPRGAGGGAVPQP